VPARRTGLHQAALRRLGDSGGSSSSSVVAASDEATLALSTLYTLTTIDPARSQKFVHYFDNLAGWTIESLVPGTGATAATTPIAVAEWDGKTFIQSAGVDSLSRGFVRNIAGAWANHNPRTGILDQVSAFGVAAGIQVVADDGGYCLVGMSDPTSTGVAPKGVFAGFEHGTNARFYEGYKATVGAGVGVDTAPSTIQLDGEWHKIFVFADGSGSYKFQVDGESPQPIPNVNTFNNLLSCVRICLAGNNVRVSWCSAIWSGGA
jgi:hypothetical protein